MTGEPLMLPTPSDRTHPTSSTSSPIFYRVPNVKTCMVAVYRHYVPELPYTFDMSPLMTERLKLSSRGCPRGKTGQRLLHVR